MDKSFTQFNFAQGEHPTSIKWNNILAIADEARRLTGPISISEATSGDRDETHYYIQMTDYPNDVGGIIEGGDESVLTRAKFIIFYNLNSDDPAATDSYARWEGIQFTSGDSNWAYEWYAELTNNDYLKVGTLGAENVDLSDAVISSFTCMRSPTTTG